MEEQTRLAGVIRTNQYLGDLLLPCIVSRENPHFLTVEYMLHTEDAAGLKDMPSHWGELHALASALEPSSLAAHFSNRKPSTKEFFSDRENAVFEKMLFPFVWRQTDRMIKVLRKEEVPVYDARQTWPNLYEKNRIGLSVSRPEVRLHFNRTGDGTQYTLTVWYDGQPVGLRAAGNLLLGIEPCHLVSGKRLLSFDTHVNGRLLLPFLKKESLHIPARLEKKYFNSFIRKVVNHMDIQAEGFRVIDLDVKPVARLSVEQDWQGHHGLALTYHYGERQVLANDRQQSFTTVEAGDEGFVFKRIRRVPDQEKRWLDKLEAIGLLRFGSFFRLPGDPFSLTGLITFLIQHKAYLVTHGFEIIQPGDQQFILDLPQVEVKPTSGMDWFDLQIVVKADGLEFPFLQLKENILSNERVYRLPDGRSFLIPEEWFARYFGIMLHGRAFGGGVRLGRYHTGLLGELLPREVVAADAEPAGDAISGPPPLHNGTLRPYQYFGFRWMRKLSGQGLGGILADDMGLGKTVQVIALLTAAFEKVNSGGGRPVDPASGASGPAGKQLSLFDTMEDASADQSLHAATEVITAQGTTSGSAGAAITGNALHDAQADDTTKAAAAMNTTQGTTSGSAGAVITGNAIHDTSAGNAGAASRKGHQPALVVMPTSIIYNWESELKRFAPQLKVLCYTGPERSQHATRLHQYDVVLTSYGVMRNDIELLKQVWFGYIVLDESQQIKNPSSQTAQSAFLLNGSHRFTLTGTPVENRLSDIWSQFHFVNPGMLGGLSDFKRYYGNPVEGDPEGPEAQRLRSLVAPFLLRRTKQQVEPELPPLTETTILCDMPEAQESLYEREKSRFRNLVMESLADEARRQQTPFLVLRALMRLRQLAIHPQLADPEANPESGKFQVITEHLETLIAEGHKILMFSSFVRHLALFEAYFQGSGVRYAKLTGATVRRDEVIASFRNSKDIQVFLLSLKAGGVGLNLTEAGYVFLLDPWWNPAAERQALNRAHRIGQDKNVFAYRFISKGTVEEKIVRLQQKKQQLTNTVIPQDQFVAGLTMEEITALFD